VRPALPAEVGRPVRRHAIVLRGAIVLCGAIVFPGAVWLRGGRERHGGIDGQAEVPPLTGGAACGEQKRPYTGHAVCETEVTGTGLETAIGAPSELPTLAITYTLPAP